MAIFGRRDRDAEPRGSQGARPEGEDDGILVAGPDSDWFKPLQTGIYTGGPDGFAALRFYPTGKVFLAQQAADEADARTQLGPGNSDPAMGQFTGAGRFVVQRRFERPIVFTVLEADDTGLTVRLTATEAARTGRFRYTFVPDSPAES
jgi:hypothetical protein